MDKIIPIAILVLFIILTASWLFSRYRMCPPDKILIVFGKVGTGQPAKCYHGGSTFVLPVLQSYSYLDLNPINIDVPLQGGNPQFGRGNHHGADARGDCLHDH